MAILSELLRDVLKRKHPGAALRLEVEDHGGARGESVTIWGKSPYCVILTDDDFGGYLLPWVCHSASFSPPHRLPIEFLAEHFGHPKVPKQKFAALDQKLDWFERVVSEGIALMDQFAVHRNLWSEAAARYEEISANSDRNEYLEEEEES